MLLRRRFTAGACLLAVAAIMAGCAIVDEYSGRAVVYNLEAEQAQGQELLLNIVRASLRRPMQFTTLQTISGTASASGTAGLSSIPIGPHSGITFKTGTVTGTVSGGPTFTVPVLDTQEFYSGLLNPIPGQLWDLFIQAGYPRELLFDLLIEKIVIRRSGCPDTAHYTECEFIFTNYVNADLEIDLFTALEEYLLGLGLTTEPLQPATNPQPASKSASASTSNGPGGNNAATIVDTSAKSFGLCFAPSSAERERRVKDALCKDPNNHSPVGAPPRVARRGPPLPGASPTAGEPHPGAQNPSVQAVAQSGKSQIARTSQLQKVQLSVEFANYLACTALIDQGQHLGDYFMKTFAGKDVTVKAYLRSTESLIYFLGELTRRQLMPGDNLTSRIFTFKYPTDPNQPFPEYPYVADSIKYPAQCGIHQDVYQRPDLANYVRQQRLFVVQYGGVPAYLDVQYNGNIYSIPSDPLVAGFTSQVLDVTKQLLNINTSAKALPQSNVLSVISP